MMIDDDNALPEGSVEDDALPTDLPSDGQGAPSADDPAADPTTDDAPAKPKKSAQERIDELTRARREAERDAEYWKAKATQQHPEPKPESQPQAEAEPDPTAFVAGEYDPAYIKAMIKWEAKQLTQASLREAEAEREARERQTTFQQRVDTAKTKFPDFEEKVFGGAQRGAWVCTQDMLEAIQESEMAGDLAYHLASNPAEAQRIANLSPRARLMELGKLEVKLADPKPQPKTVSDAPDPAPLTRGASGRFKVAPDTGDFAAFDKAY